MSRQPLSVGETLKLHGSFFQQGLSDSMKWNNVLETLTSNQKLQGSVMKAALLQVIILVSALAIEPLLDQVNSRGETTTSGIIPILFHVSPSSSFVFISLLRTYHSYSYRLGIMAISTLNRCHLLCRIATFD